LVLSGPVIGGNPAFEGLLAMDPIPYVPIDPTMLSRDPAVGTAYEADALVYHGPLLRPTLESLFKSVYTIASGPPLGPLPTLWMHGETDLLAPCDVTRAAIDRIRGGSLISKIYAGAAHEIFNETNRDEVLRDTTAFLDNVL
jgi:alpha-beta hydrolase superfamily lysophospholipase